jgi:hypothetical protein
MKTLLFSFILVFELISLQAEPTQQVLMNTANQLLGSQATQDIAVAQLIQYGKSSLPYIADFLSAKEGDIKSAAWRVVNGIGFESSVEFYIIQLDSSDESIRFKAIKTLTALTNKYYGYNAQDYAARRAEIRAKWSAWLNAYRVAHPSS